MSQRTKENVFFKTARVRLHGNKQYPDVKFASPVSGTVREVVRGERRKVLCIKVDADAQQEFTDFGKKDVGTLSGEQVINALLEAGIFGYINQLPYAVSTNPSAFRSLDDLALLQFH